MQRSIILPPQFALATTIAKNSITQIKRKEHRETVEIEQWQEKRVKGEAFNLADGRRVLVVPKSVQAPTEFSDVLIASEGVPSSEDGLFNQKLRWLYPLPNVPDVADAAQLQSVQDLCEEIRSSWKGRFSFREEIYQGTTLIEPGLRAPQIGALHAVLAHWQIGNRPATVVMPTGTGKTETMLSLLVHQRLKCLLVIVPTSALRDQIGEKFLTLGLLSKCGVISSGVSLPIVGKLEHKFSTPEEAEIFFQSCNVVVTTMQVLTGCTDAVQRKIAEVCSHLFIDEAHHIGATSWDRFRHRFLSEVSNPKQVKPVVQFTATPFRNDQKPVDGRVIFNYPLRKAQEEQLFRPIQFKPIEQFDDNKSDEDIAQAAIGHLCSDLKTFDHLMMVRTETIERAKSVHEIYERLAPELKPVLAHSKLKSKEQKEVLFALRSRRSRIVVCVNMFGEGFDLPELKIAALHDVHKSLSITLQFTGRFTRAKAGLGDATVIANIANDDVNASIRQLYSQNADWNLLLQGLSHGATGKKELQSDFIEGFNTLPDLVSIQNITPKMSAVVYSTSCAEWSPEKIEEAVGYPRLQFSPSINHKERIAVFVVFEQEAIEWGEVQEIQNIAWDIYIVYWNDDRKLLFINSSNTGSLHEGIAKIVAGSDVELIKGEQVYRCLAGIKRLMLMNLGLRHEIGRAIRFTMSVGSDIATQLSDPHLRSKSKTNVFGLGFEGGNKASAGCSSKGRVWSYKIAEDILDWKEWCNHVGDKLLDNSIQLDGLFEKVIQPQLVTARPNLVPLVIEWPEEFYARSEEAMTFLINGERVPFFDVGFELCSHDKTSPLRFRIFSPLRTQQAEYEIQFSGSGVQYVPTGPERVEIAASQRTKPNKPIEEIFQKDWPLIHFEDGSNLRGPFFSQLPSGSRNPFDFKRIQVWDWKGIDLKKESQGWEKLSDSIQYKVIEEAKASKFGVDYEIIFDDDTSYEAADVVALKVEDNRLIVHLFHCKFSQKIKSGSRCKDLYEVCGQAQKSAYWKNKAKKLIEHLRRRESSYLKRYQPPVSRFEKGTQADLKSIERQCEQLIPEFKIFIVQPGLSKAGVEDDQLDLLGATDLYLQETSAIPFEVVGSA